VLKEQVQTLQQEIAELPYHPRYQPIAIQDGPFSLRIRTDGPAEARLLDEIIVSMESSLACLQTHGAIEQVRNLVQEFNAAKLADYSTSRTAQPGRSRKSRRSVATAARSRDRLHLAASPS
jgi:hypothetical protein